MNRATDPHARQAQAIHTFARRSIGKLATLAAACVLATAPALAQQAPTVWRMATSWPENLPVLHESAVDFAESVTQASGGRLKIELVGPSVHGVPGDLLNAVREGRFDLAHTTAHYYAKQIPAIDFFTTIPFGLTATENHAWLIYGGGQQLFDDIMASRDIVPIVVMNTSVQMGGWFKKQIRTVEDLKGVRMRISGFPGRVIARLGGVPVGMPIGQIVEAFEADRIDAAEAVVPALDMALPFEKFAPYQYEPWHEPDAVGHAFIARAKFEALPADLQSIVRQVAQAASLRSIARGLERNAPATRELEKRGATVHAWPPEVLKALRDATAQEVAAITDPESRRVADSLLAYKAKVRSYGAQTIGAVLRTP